MGFNTAFKGLKVLFFCKNRFDNQPVFHELPLNLSGSGQGPVADHCGQSNKPFVSIKGTALLDHLRA